MRCIRRPVAAIGPIMVSTLPRYGGYVGAVQTPRVPFHTGDSTGLRTSIIMGKKECMFCYCCADDPPSRSHTKYYSYRIRGRGRKANQEGHRSYFDLNTPYSPPSLILAEPRERIKPELLLVRLEGRLIIAKGSVQKLRSQKLVMLGTECT
jgi:hypothetical protein